MPDDNFFGPGYVDPGNIEVKAAFNALLSIVTAQLAVLWNYVASLAKYVIGIFKTIGQFFTHLWSNFFKTLFKRFYDQVKKSQIWNDLKHGHIVKFLHDLRALLDQLFIGYVKPILDMLQHIRQGLLLLRLMHVKFAEKLDHIITQIQQDIAGEFLKVRAMVNNVIDLANILADPSLLLRKPTLIASLRRILPALSVVLTRRPLGYWFPSPRRNPSPGQAPVSLPGPGGTAATFPLASSFLGTDDGLASFPMPQLGFLSTASAVDDIDALDFFMDELYPVSPCADSTECYAKALQLMIGG